MENLHNSTCKKTNKNEYLFDGEKRREIREWRIGEKEHEEIIAHMFCFDKGEKGFPPLPILYRLLFEICL